jgi:hypothetical protein
MKKAASILFVILVALMFVPVAWAQGPEAQQALYQKFLDNRPTKPEVAYEVAKEYLQQYAANAPADDKYVDYLKKWVGKYEKQQRRQKLIEFLSANKVNEAFAAAKQVLQDYPDDAGLLYDLARTGITAAGGNNHTNDADTLAYAKQALQALQSGKNFNPDQPLTEAARNENIGFLSLGVGMLTAKSSPNEAVDSLMNAAKLEGSAKRNPLTYGLLAEIYDTVYYTPVSDQYTKDCKTEEQAKTPACTEMKPRVEAAADHLLDALAHALALANLPENKSRFESYQSGWMETLTTLYKYRHQNSDAGMKEFVEGINAKPLMERMK